MSDFQKFMERTHACVNVLFEQHDVEGLCKLKFPIIEAMEEIQKIYPERDDVDCFRLAEKFKDCFNEDIDKKLCSLGYLKSSEHPIEEINNHIVYKRSNPFGGWCHDSFDDYQLKMQNEYARTAAMLSIIQQHPWKHFTEIGKTLKFEPMRAPHAIPKRAKSRSVKNQKLQAPHVLK